MFMTHDEIVRSIRIAKDPSKQIHILADINLCHWSEIVEILRAEGIKVNVRRRKGATQ